MKTIEVSVSSINGGDFARGYCGATFTVLTYAALNPAAGVVLGGTIGGIAGALTGAGKECN